MKKEKVKSLTLKDAADCLVHGAENLSRAAAGAAESMNEFAKTIAPRSPWEFAKTLPTKARLNYIAESLKKWKISEIKEETTTMEFAGMFSWRDSPQGLEYWSNLIPV